MEHPKVELKIFNESHNPLPTYATLLSSGFDLMSDGQYFIASGERKLISTGLRVSIPVGYELQIRSRSGLAAKNGICVLNSPGTIDADFSGKISVILFNTSSEEFKVISGMKIAQAVLCPIVQASFIVCENVSQLGETVRGEGGFGSTGV